MDPANGISVATLGFQFTFQWWRWPFWGLTVHLVMMSIWLKSFLTIGLLVVVFASSALLAMVLFGWVDVWKKALLIVIALASRAGH